MVLGGHRVTSLSLPGGRHFSGETAPDMHRQTPWAFRPIRLCRRPILTVLHMAQKHTALVAYGKGAIPIVHGVQDADPLPLRRTIGVEIGAVGHDTQAEGQPDKTAPENSSTTPEGNAGSPL
jgi:hypothetical protein